MQGIFLKSNISLKERHVERKRNISYFNRSALGDPSLTLRMSALKCIFIMRGLPIFVLLMNALSTSAQKPFTSPQKITINGYIKTLQNWQFPDNGKIYSNQLLHNRLNVKWNIHPYLIMSGEWRSRIISGDELKFYSNYLQLLNNPNDRWDLSVAWVNRPDLIILTNTERFWLSYKKNKWFFRAGRQRINWSTTNTWNPNDIFNSYNFLDFDYEERPGCDAFQTRYTINATSNIELGIGFLGTTGKPIGGLKYMRQVSGWDLQAIAGIYEKNPTLGASFAGSIREAGIKGELQFFNKAEKEIFNWSAEADYVFKKGWYGNIGLLYNSDGINQRITDRSEIVFKMTPYQQMPASWNGTVTVQKEFSSIVKSGATIIYAPVTNLLLIIPSCSIGLADNFEVHIIMQQFILKETSWNSILYNGFLRLKYSF